MSCRTLEDFAISTKSTKVNNVIKRVDEFIFKLKLFLFVFLLLTGGYLLSCMLPLTVGEVDRPYVLFGSDIGFLVLGLHKAFAFALFSFSMCCLVFKLFKKINPTREAAFLLTLFLTILVALKAEWFAVAYWEPMRLDGSPLIDNYPYRIHLFRAGIKHYFLYSLMLVLILFLDMRAGKRNEDTANFH
jgi:hypothetical protein